MLGHYNDGRVYFIFQPFSPWSYLLPALALVFIAIILFTIKCWIIEGEESENIMRIKSSIDFLSKIGHLPSTGDVKLSKSDSDAQIDTCWVITPGNGLDFIIQTKDGKYLTPSRTDPGRLKLSKKCRDTWQFEKVTLDASDASETSLDPKLGQHSLNPNSTFNPHQQQMVNTVTDEYE